MKRDIIHYMNPNFNLLQLYEVVQKVGRGKALNKKWEHENVNIFI